MFKSFALARIAGLLAAAALLAACSPPAEEDARSPEEIVAERAQAWWQAHIDKDFGAAWELATPGFREATSREIFIDGKAIGNISYLEAEVQRVKCEEQVCEATVDVIYQPTGAPGALAKMKTKTSNKEKWLKIDGQWWRSVKQ